jgi:hypothetical protein
MPLRLRLLVAALALSLATPVVAPAAPKKPAAARKKTPSRKPAAPPAPPEPEAPPPEPAAEPAPPAPTAEETPPAPAPEEPRPKEPPAKEAAPDLARLRAEHAALRDALFRSRARREVLEQALLSTQLAAVIQWDASRRYTLKRAELRLDGVRLWETTEGQVPDRPVSLAARSAPAGPHVLGIRIEVRSRENPKLGYVSEQSFSLDLREGKKTTVEITVDEDGDLPSYNPDIEIEIDED